MTLHYHELPPAILTLLAAGLLLMAGCANEPAAISTAASMSAEETSSGSSIEQASHDDLRTTFQPELLMNPEELTEADWKQRLTDQQYNVLRNKGTERAFQNEYWDSKIEGIYRCAGCNQPLYDSAAKYESGTGWPSFYQPIEPAAVSEEADNTLFSRRTEILCSRCNSHIGHVFNDGPQPTGLRYCMNSAAMVLEPKETADEQSEPDAKEEK